MEHKGYYSIASGRWVSHAEVVASGKIVEAHVQACSAALLRREAYETLADEAAARGDFAEARRILAEGRASEAGPGSVRA